MNWRFWRKRRIASATIVHSHAFFSCPELHVVFDDGEGTVLFTLGVNTFKAEEFLGLTEHEAMAFRRSRRPNPDRR